MTSRLFRFLCVLFLLAPVAWGGARDRQGSRGSGDEVVPGVVIVKFKEGASPAAGSLAKSSGQLTHMLARHGVQSLERAFPNVQPPGPAKASAQRPVDLSQVYYANVPSAADVKEIARRLSTLPEVEYAEPKYMNYIQESPNDPFFSTSQTGYFGRLEALTGWGIAKGSPSVAIAVVDGGTYWQHEDLVGNLWVNAAEDINGNGTFEPADNDGLDQDGNGKVDDVIGWNYTANSNDPRGPSNQPNNRAHGTATASHFGAVTNNGVGMAGSSWNCRILPVCAASRSRDDAIEYGYEGIQYAASRGVKVINCSWGRSGAFSQFERDIVASVSQAGVLIVTAAGNDSINVDLTPYYPAAFPEVFAVGATNSTSDSKAWFSNYGINITVYAPGTNIWSAQDGGGYLNGGSGTSYSSPLVAGLAGIIRSQHPDWSPEQIKAQIRTSSDSVESSNPLYQGSMGHGRVNFGRALTESHAGIQVLTGSVLTPSGRDFFVPGDTVVVTALVRNILPREAVNLQFAISSSDPALLPNSDVVTIASLPANDEALLPPMLMQVGSIMENRRAAIALRWVSNGNERDALAYRTNLFSAMPRWFLQLTPTSNQLFSVRAVSPTVAWAAGGDGNATGPIVVRTTDGGQRWMDATGTLSGVDLYCVFAVDDLRAWVGTGDGRIFATVDGGTTWSNQPYPGTQSPFIDGIWFFDANNGYAMGDPGPDNRYVILKTANGGLAWEHLPSEPLATSGEAGWNNSFWWSDPSHGWFGTNSFRVRGTSDGGATWFSGTTAYQSSFGVSFKDNLTGVAIFDNGRSLRTTDGGVTWGTPADVSPGAHLVGVAFAPGTDAVWSSDGLSPFRSTDAGQSWTIQSSFPFTGAILHLSVADSMTGWASTSFGELLKYQATATDIESGPPPVPAEFALEQNYPNPFNPKTVISSQLPVAGDVKLVVYDVLGREVAVLVNERREAGTYRDTFSGAGLASGLYFYRLTAGDFVQARKMILLR